MKMKRIAPLMGIIALGGIAFAVANSPKAQEKADQVTASASLTVQASATATSAQSVQYQGVVGETALQTLRNTHKIETKTESFGEYVTSIDGLVADSAHYWAFYVNGAYASVGAGDYQSQAGDAIEWKYEALTQ